MLEVGGHHTLVHCVQQGHNISCDLSQGMAALMAITVACSLIAAILALLILMLILAQVDKR